MPHPDTQHPDTQHPDTQHHGAGHHGPGRSASGHRVSATPGSQRVTVVIDGRLVADSTRPVLLHETGLPVRYYLPAQDVRLELFEPTDTSTTCPFKGQAAYWAYRDGDRFRPDAAWAYQDPYPEVAAIKGHLAFYDTVADITVDGD